MSVPVREKTSREADSPDVDSRSDLISLLMHLHLTSGVDSFDIY
jgi:hypothetical protein